MRAGVVGLASLLIWVGAGAVAAPTPAQEAALRMIAARAQATESDAVLVLRDGQLLLDRHRAGTTPGAIEMMSCTKSLVALGIGRLLTQGRLRSLDQPVADFYPEWKRGRKAAITLRMLMNHTSGLQNVPNTTVEIYPAPDGLQLALAAELSDAPGARFSYNNKAMNLLAGVIERAAGERMDQYLQREVLGPLGVRGPSWNEQGGYDRAGHPYAMAGWVATAADAARVGQLVLDEGRVGAVQLIAPAFMREMVAQSQPFTPGYGLLWWRHVGAVEAYEAQGYLGQYIVVVPSVRLVAVRQIAERDDWPDDRPWPYGYDDFVTRVLELARTLRVD
jgi:CubicO group peptidase (beta-lactamase class C family)